jgi:hypothetical protein
MAAPIFRTALLALLVSLFAVAVPGIASAQDDAAVKKVTNLNKKALDAYGKQDYEAARALLKEALELCASAGLDKHPIRARTHIHFGIVAIVGFKQREVGIKQFRKALEVQPDIKLTKQLATPELQDAFEEAVLAEAGGAPAGGGGGEATGGGEGGSPPQADDGGEEGGGSRPPPKRPPPRKKAGDEDDEKSDYKGQKGVFFFALTGGSGVGLVKGEGELDPNTHKLEGIGFAVAQTAQITPEVGFFLAPNMLLSAQLRLQYVGGLNGKPGAGCGMDNFCAPGNGAVAGFVKFTYLMGDGPFHLTIGGEVGGGNIRHAVNFPDNTCKSSATSTMNESCVDTLAGGPFLIGPTFGFFYEIGDAINLIVAINTALGVPHFTFNFDGSLGIGFRI